MGLVAPNISATAVNNPVDLKLGPEPVGLGEQSAEECPLWSAPVAKGKYSTESEGLLFKVVDSTTVQ